MGVGVHAVAAAAAGCNVLDVAQTQRAAAVLVALELGNRGLGGVGGVEPDHAAATGPAAGLVLDLSLLDLANGREEFNQIVIARRPRKLICLLVMHPRVMGVGC